jgi:hypothetical protein
VFLQEFSLAPIFHSPKPAIVHASSVSVAIVLDKPISPGATTGLHVAYLPAPQSVQYVDPIAVEYWQSVQYVDPVAAEYLPVSQSVHTADPVPFLYLPATHASIHFRRPKAVLRRNPRSSMRPPLRTCRRRIPRTLPPTTALAGLNKNQRRTAGTR